MEIKLRSIIKAVGSIFLIILVLQWVGVNAFLENLTKINLWYYTLAILSYFLLVSLWALKIYCGFRGVGENISYTLSWWANLWGMLGNVFQHLVGFSLGVLAIKNVTKQNIFKVSGVLLAIQSIELVVRIVLTTIGI